MKYFPRFLVGIALAKKGIGSTIFEKKRRDEVTQDIDDHPLIIRLPGVLALEELNLIEKIKSHGSQLRGMYTFVQSSGMSLNECDSFHCTC
jgi:2-polyprenyl-6-methoxyphenol hydroxylase-like FAD-dependent oxidoreductase